MQTNLQQLAKHIDAKIYGDSQTTVSGLCSIDDIQPGFIVFAKGEKNFNKAISSNAAAILTDQDTQPNQKPLLHVKNPLESFVSLIHYFYPENQSSNSIHPTAVIEEGVKIGKDVSIGPYVCIGKGASIENGVTIKSHVSIGEQVHIGKQSTIYANVVIYDKCLIGNFVAIHAGTIIGSDGFGYHQEQGIHQKIPHVGRVVIEDNVEIGAGTTIDRATLGDTLIGEGTKIDNQVQIAHSVKLGKHNIVCAFTGIAGSSSSGDYVIFAANVGVSDHVRIDDNVILGARTGVPSNKHLRGHQTYLGSPSRPKEKAIELELGVSRIKGMRKRIAKLEEQLQNLTNNNS